MPFINAPVTTDALTGNGDANGYVTVTSNANYYPGARVWLKSNTQAPKEYIVTDLNGTTKVGLREIQVLGDNTHTSVSGPQYGRTPCTQWLTTDVAQINQEASVVRVELSNISKVSLV